MSSESNGAGRLQSKKRKRNVGLTILSGLATAMIVVGTGGCSSSTIPAPLSDLERAQVNAAHFEAVVGVEQFRFPVYSHSLVLALKETGLFDRVDHLDSLRTEPTLVARVERTIYGTATIPILTGLSLGFIPTTVEEEHGHSFSLRVPGETGHVVPIEFSYRGPTTLGWYAAILNLQKKRAGGSPKTHPQFYDALALEIVSHSDAIRGLLR